MIGLFSQTQTSTLREAAVSALETKHHRKNDPSLPIIVSVSEYGENPARYSVYVRDDFWSSGRRWKLEFRRDSFNNLKLFRSRTLSSRRHIAKKELTRLVFLISNLFPNAGHADNQNFCIKITCFGRKDAVTEKVVSFQFEPGGFQRRSRLYFTTDANMLWSAHDAKVFLSGTIAGSEFTLDLWSPEAGFLQGDDVDYFTFIINSFNCMENNRSEWAVRSSALTFARRVHLKRTAQS
jgi:hypothetical protein